VRDSAEDDSWWIVVVSLQYSRQHFWKPCQARQWTLSLARGVSVVTLMGQDDDD
jgi:hypothetical protein